MSGLSINSTDLISQIVQKHRSQIVKNSKKYKNIRWRNNWSFFSGMLMKQTHN
jgi:hypothetical protein